MITVSMLAKIRRMHFRDGVPLRDISRRTGLSRNTIRRWLREPSTGEPKYPKRASKSVIDAWAEQLRQWLIADSRRPKRDRRTATQMYEELRAAGYDGSYQRVCAFVRSWKQERDEGPQRGAFVPMSFEYGDAFQFDWSCEYVFICGLRRRLEVAHVRFEHSGRRSECAQCRVGRHQMEKAERLLPRSGQGAPQYVHDGRQPFAQQWSRMMRIRKLEHRFVRSVPRELESGILYVSMEYGTAVHSCCCGCGEQVVTPFPRPIGR